MFRDRADAGRQLARGLMRLQAEDPVVLALPRGGVPVAYEVAVALGAPLDVILVRKLGVPAQPELAMGALGEGGVRVLNRDVLERISISPDRLAEVEAREAAELARRAAAFRGDGAMTPISARTVIVIDDGIATGSTARAALRVARAHGAQRVVLAVPVAPPGTVDAFADDADEVVVLEEPSSMWAIGTQYDDFRQTTDAEVVALLDANARPKPKP
jgi:putative phosphoribosyl transferase